MSLPEILDARARLTPSRIGYRFLSNRCRDEKELSYENLRTNVLAIVEHILALTSHQQPIACIFDPGLEFVTAFFAILWSGRIAVPLAVPKPSDTPMALLQQLRHSGATVCLSSRHVIEAINARDLGFRDFMWIDVASIAPATRYVSPMAGTRDIAFLQYTAGSTGNPKGVVVSHDNLLHNSKQISDAFAHSSESVGFIWLPHHHDMGLVGGLIQPLYCGFPVYLCSPLDFIKHPHIWLEAIGKFSVTTSGGPNFAFEQCLRRIPENQRDRFDLATWNVAFCGAERVSIDTLDRFFHAFRASGFKRSAFLPCYGLAEATLMVSGTKSELGPATNSIPGDSRNKYVDCGCPVSNIDVRVVNPETRMPVITGTGEIWVRGPSISRGYWRDQESTSQTFANELPGQHEHTYLRTGDVGFMIDNHLYLCGRLKSIIIVRGINHNVEDIEQTASSSHPDLVGFTSAVFVLEEETDSVVVVLIEALPKVRQQNKDQRSVLIAEVRQRIVARHGFAPHQIALVPVGAIPRNRAGKVVHHQCPEFYRTLEKYHRQPFEILDNDATTR